MFDGLRSACQCAGVEGTFITYVLFTIKLMPSRPIVLRNSLGIYNILIFDLRKSREFNMFFNILIRKLRLMLHVMYKNCRKIFLSV